MRGVENYRQVICLQRSAPLAAGWANRHASLCATLHLLSDRCEPFRTFSKLPKCQTVVDRDPLNSLPREWATPRRGVEPRCVMTCARDFWIKGVDWVQNRNLMASDWTLLMRSVPPGFASAARGIFSRQFFAAFFSPRGTALHEFISIERSPRKVGGAVPFLFAKA